MNYLILSNCSILTFVPVRQGPWLKPRAASLSGWWALCFFHQEKKVQSWRHEALSRRLPVWIRMSTRTSQGARPQVQHMALRSTVSSSNEKVNVSHSKGWSFTQSWRFSSSGGLTAFHQPRDKCASPRLKSPRYWIVYELSGFLVENTIRQDSALLLGKWCASRKRIVYWCCIFTETFEVAHRTSFCHPWTSSASSRRFLFFFFLFSLLRYLAMAIPLSRTQLALFFILLCPVNIIGLWW